MSARVRHRDERLRIGLSRANSKNQLFHDNVIRKENFEKFHINGRAYDCGRNKGRKIHTLMVSSLFCSEAHVDPRFYLVTWNGHTAVWSSCPFLHVKNAYNLISRCELDSLIIYAAKNTILKIKILNVRCRDFLNAREIWEDNFVIVIFRRLLVTVAFASR